MADKVQVRTVHLEFLRPGPAHNQLLSPLTPYLSVCGDSPAGVVHVPYEHAVFERRLAHLRYDGAGDDRLAQLHDTGVDVSRMLAAVPGLPGAINADVDAPSSLVHLRVTLSAAELALLPFELSKVPMMVEATSDAWLALKSRPPVCITRHIRTVSTQGVTWPSAASILFVAGPTGDIPFDAHRRALEQAVAPYRYPDRDDQREGVDDRHTHYGERLTIIRDASVDDVVAAVKMRPYTHVHVLAHGAVTASPTHGRSFGLRLRGGCGGVEIVSGERFASALRRTDEAAVRLPFAVTLASCDSSFVANVVEPASGASFVHTLHQAGIPLVVGSQFPLTKQGSITLVELFYAGVMQGRHPHPLMHQIRSELHARYGADAHDWASLVVYEALPADMDAQLEHARYRQGKMRLDAALQRVDLAVSASEPRGAAAAGIADLERAVDAALDSLPAEGAYAIECRGLRASAMKRLAQAAFTYGRSQGAEEAAVQQARAVDRLDAALATYQAAAEMYIRNDLTALQRVATLHWLAVQRASLQRVLRHAPDPETMATARLAASLYVDHSDRGERAWAHASLAELALLDLTHRDGSVDPAAAEEAVLLHVDRLLSLCSGDAFQVSSTRKQFERYVNWWGSEAFADCCLARIRHPRTPGPWPDDDRLRRVAETALNLLGARATRHAPPQPTPRPQPADAAPAASDPAPPQEDVLSRPHPRRRRPAERAFLEVTMLPAQWGDCLWIEYGVDPASPSRILIDCGPAGTGSRLLAHIEALPPEDRRVELMILTHIDDDHIGGAIPFFEAERGGLQIGDLWFNGYRHLDPLLSAEQGERFATLIEHANVPWNRWRDGEAIVLPDADDVELPVHVLPGGLRLTLLAPTSGKLESLRVKWEAELARKNLTPGLGIDRDELLSGVAADSDDVEAMAALPFRSDTAAPNASSIAVLAEFEGKSILLTGDAQPPLLEPSLRRLLASRGLERLPLGALKVSHHGSHGNTSSELLSLLDCRRYLISTNGQKFSHPHGPTISRILMHGGPAPVLCFNYVAEGKNTMWARPDLQERHGYTCTYPTTTAGLTVTL